jgi:hypothetical protein
MYSSIQIGGVLLVFAAFWALPSNASFRNAVQTFALDQCRLERSAHLHYQCDIPAADLQPGETILRAEAIQRVLYPCEVRIYSHTTGFRITVTKLSDPKFLGFNLSEATRCLQKVKQENDVLIRFQILE